MIIDIDLSVTSLLIKFYLKVFTIFNRDVPNSCEKVFTLSLFISLEDLCYIKLKAR